VSELGVLGSSVFLLSSSGVGSIRFDNFDNIFAFAAEIPPQTKTPDSLCIRIRKVRSIVTWIIIQFLLFSTAAIKH
jgi:hypothetical protein